MSENFCEIAYAECELKKFKNMNEIHFFISTTAVEKFVIAKTRKSTCIKDAILQIMPLKYHLLFVCNKLLYCIHINTHNKCRAQFFNVVYKQICSIFKLYSYMTTHFCGYVSVLLLVSMFHPFYGFLKF